MARLRAVVVIQPPGFGGIPVFGHPSAAIANASATASSARSMSPKTRIKVAVHRPGFAPEDLVERVGHPWAGRTSTGPSHAAAPLAAHSNAASRSTASIIQNPPICSFVSA